MGIKLTNPVAVSTVPTANYFDLAYYQILNDTPGVTTPASDPTTVAHLEVGWNAWMAGEDGKTTPVASCGPVKITGADLLAVCADSDARTQAYKAANVPAGVAYALGQRDAIYAWLTANNYIKTS